MSSWWSSLNPFAGVNAEEAQDDDKDKTESKEDGDENNEEKEEGDDEEEQEEDGGDDEEEEEEEEEEPEDPKPALVEHAMNHQCPREKHHFDACAERVAKAQESGEEHHGHTEDCAEEFLHLMHCVDQKIAEPLFRLLK